MLPFIGKCHVAYLPRGKVIGLSKIARLVNVFARRLQIQENLTSQIANCILEKTNASGAAVIIEAKHMCMMMRGVEKQNSTMTTSCMLSLQRQLNNSQRIPVADQLANGISTSSTLSAHRSCAQEAPVGQGLSEPVANL